MRLGSTHMKKSSGHLLAFAVVVAAAVPLTGQAQEFFRDYGTSRSSDGIGLVEPSDYSYQDTSPSGLAPLRPGQELTSVEQAEESDKYNFALGPVRFAIAVGFGVEYNDNITLAETGRESDFIFRPSLNLAATWRLSDLNTLHFNVGLSYAFYDKNSQYDTGLISPNTDLALTVFTGPVKWTIRDRVSYQEDAYQIPVLSNVAVYRRWENQGGIQGDWAINQNVDVTLGYDHYNLWASGDVFDLQDRSIDTIFLKPAVKISPAVKLGVNASYSFIGFTDSDRSSGDGILAGPFIDWQISDVTNMHLEGGYQQLAFRGPSFYEEAEISQLGLSAAETAAVKGILEDDSNANTYYIKFELDNKPSENFQHRLFFSKTAEIGFVSNYYNLYHVEYSADWKCLPHMDFGPSVFYEYYSTSGPIGEDAYRIGATLGLRYHFSNSVTLGLDYRYLYKQSNLVDANYYQNLVFLSLYYKF